MLQRSVRTYTRIHIHTYTQTHTYTQLSCKNSRKNSGIIFLRQKKHIATMVQIVSICKIIIIMDDNVLYNHSDSQKIPKYGL